MFVFTFHIESSLLLAWEKNINTAYLNAVKIVSSGTFKGKAEKSCEEDSESTQPWLTGFNDQNINSD